ncbi:MAG: Gfo/Idh/MocA family oxidoreductase [Myxococcota bacterium]|nr:Gfo/Idh/MocA family oxidoreductase [Myxococcota bacterium]
MKLGMAVIGLGVGEQHARAIARHPRATLAAVHDLDPARSRAVVAELGGQVAPSYDAMLADPAIDAVAIATYDDQHAVQVLAAFAAGKHVFCEKPLCRTLDELRAISAARGDRHLACNLILRASPLYRWLRDAIRAGELGELYAVDGDYLYGRLDKITEGWRVGVDDYSVIQGGGVHLVDLVMWLIGERPHRVHAIGNRIVTRDSAFRYSDYVAATYEMPTGVVARITANFGCVHKHQHVLRVFGTKATFIHDDAGARLHELRDPGGPPRVLDHAPVAATKGDLIPAFVDGILDHADPAPVARHEFDVITACMAADRALAAHEPLAIEYPGD